MKIWIDDVREAPADHVGFKEINLALRFITTNIDKIDVIDLDHDAGDYRRAGKDDYIVILKELERLTKRCKIDCSHVTFRIHSMNPVGVQNMRAIIQSNGWKESF